MALPRLNETPSYEVKIPSTGQKVSYRPYLVKEEKVLMMAFESGDQKQALRSIVDTLKACIQEDIDLVTLTSFDIEYLFTQIRSRSVGENANILIPCKECDHKNEIELDVSTIEVNIPKVDKVIRLTDQISVEMKYPSYQALMVTDLEAGELELGMALIGQCIDAVLTEEERYDASEVSAEDIQQFIESMTAVQFQSVAEFIQTLPALSKDIDFTCKSCGSENTTTLKGLNDFLS